MEKRSSTLENIDSGIKILVTGGFGYLGGRLGQFLSNSGHEVCLGSREIKSSPEWLPKAETIQTDWQDDRSLSKACDGVDLVIHAAGMNAKDCINNPKLALEFNGAITAKFIEIAKLSKVKKFIYLSTAHVYSSPLIGVISEKTEPANDHPYAVSNISGENAVIEASKDNEINILIARLSNAFGAPAHKDVNCWDLLVNDLCKQAVRRKKIVLNTDGKQVRDFITLNNFCRAIECLMSKDQKELSSNIVNIGGGTKTVIEMSRFVKKCCEEVLGINLSIERPQSSLVNTYNHFIYKMNWLDEIEFEFISDEEREIKNLLKFVSLNS